MSRLPAEARRAAFGWAVSDAETVARYRAKVTTVPGSSCSWWTAAVAGRGHGRFWLGAIGGQDVVVVAHRFGFALEHGLDELERASVLGHRCDNPLCQRIGAGHVVRSSHTENRRAWAARRRLAGGPLTDRRGSRGRSTAVRDALRGGGALAAVVAAVGLADDGVQLPLWAAEQA